MQSASKIVFLPKRLMRYQVIGVVMVVVLIIGIGSLGYVVSKDLKKAKASYQKQSKKVEELKEHKRLLENQIANYQTAIEEFKNLLFAEKDISLFLSGISETSRKNNVQVASIANLKERTIEIGASGEKIDSRKRKEVNKGEEEEKSLIINVSPTKVEIQGEIADVVAVLSAIEKTRQLLTVTEFKFSLQKYPMIFLKFRIEFYGVGGKEN